MYVHLSIACHFCPLSVRVYYCSHLYKISVILTVTTSRYRHDTAWLCSSWEFQCSWRVVWLDGSGVYYSCKHSPHICFRLNMEVIVVSLLLVCTKRYRMQFWLTCTAPTSRRLVWLCGLEQYLGLWCVSVEPVHCAVQYVRVYTYKECTVGVGCFWPLKFSAQCEYVVPDAWDGFGQQITAARFDLFKDNSINLNPTCMVNEAFGHFLLH